MTRKSAACAGLRTKNAPTAPSNTRVKRFIAISLAIEGVATTVKSYADWNSLWQCQAVEKGWAKSKSIENSLRPDGEDRAHDQQGQQQVAIIDGEIAERPVLIEHLAEREYADEAEPVEEADCRALTDG